MMELTGSPAKRDKYAAVKAGLKENIRKHLWDEEREKYIPHIYLNGSPFPASFDENRVYYHGGTAVAILAGLLTKDEIATANRKMLENVRAAGAQSIGLTMYPTYPAGAFQGVGMYPYGYQNGGDWTWFGARMIWGLIENGFIKEAYTELLPMLNRVIANKGFNEWYTQSGEPMGSGTFRGEAGVLVKAIEMLRAWAKDYQAVPMAKEKGHKVLFTFGQSNSANHGQGLYKPHNKVLNYFDGKVYPSQDPLIGATGEGGSVWNILADKMIDGKMASSVTLVPIGVGGVKVADWAEGGFLYDKLIRTIEQIKKQGMEPDYILWHQGESDNIENTSAEDYMRRFESIRNAFRSRGIDAPIVIAVASYHPACLDEEKGCSRAVREAQQQLARKYKDIFAGPDTDLLDKAYQRADGIHFSSPGQQEHAAGWFEALKKIK